MKLLNSRAPIAPLEEGKFKFDVAVHIAQRGNGVDVGWIACHVTLVRVERAVWVIYKPGRITEVEYWPIVECECGLRHVVIGRVVACECGTQQNVPDWWPVLACCRCGEHNLVPDLGQEEFTCQVCDLTQWIVKTEGFATERSHA